MTTPDPQDLPARLRAEAGPPAQHPSFFETLAFSAGQSTPTAGPGLFMRVRRSKVAAVVAGTALLLSGAAYAGGLMGGGPGQDASTTITPAHHESSTKSTGTKSTGTSAKGTSGTTAKHHVDSGKKHDQGKPAKHNDGDDDPSTDPSTDPTSPPTDPKPRHRCDGRYGDRDSHGWHHWQHWGDGDGDGDHDGGWGDQDGDGHGGWGDHDSGGGGDHGGWGGH